MPRLIALYIRQVIIGFAVSALFVALLLYTNVANLWHLVTSSDAGLLALGLLWLFNGIVFAGVQFGIAIMRMAEEDDTKGGKRDALPLDPVPAEAMAQAATRHTLRGRQRA